jgi:hypothetical protein
VNTTALGNITNIASGNSSLTLQTGSGNTTAVTIDTSQNVGIGVTSPTQSWTGGSAKVQQLQGGSSQVTVLRINESSGTYGDLQLVSSGSAETGVYNFANGALRFGTNGTERARINSIGSLLINSTTTITQAGVFLQKNNSTSNAIVTYNYTANPSSSATVTFSTSSLGFSDTLSYCVEVTASAYGNSNTGVGTYKGMVTGYSGGSAYQVVTNIVNTMSAGGSFSLAGGSNSVTLTINNTDGGSQKFGVVRFNVTWL